MNETFLTSAAARAAAAADAANAAALADPAFDAYRAGPVNAGARNAPSCEHDTAQIAAR